MVNMQTGHLVCTNVHKNVNVQTCKEIKKKEVFKTVLCTNTFNYINYLVLSQASTRSLLKSTAYR